MPESEKALPPAPARPCSLLPALLAALAIAAPLFLLAAARMEARERGCRRLWLVTTNDNTPAVRFYQRRDFDICAFHRNAITESRRLKPEIPDEGLFGIRVRHEIELEYLL